MEEYREHLKWKIHELLSMLEDSINNNVDPTPL